MRIKTAKIELKVGAEVQLNELWDEVTGYVIDISRCLETQEQAILLRLSDGSENWYYAKHIKRILKVWKKKIKKAHKKLKMGLE